MRGSRAFPNPSGRALRRLWLQIELELAFAYTDGHVPDNIVLAFDQVFKGIIVPRDPIDEPTFLKDGGRVADRFGDGGAFDDSACAETVFEHTRKEQPVLVLQVLLQRVGHVLDSSGAVFEQQDEVVGVCVRADLVPFATAFKQFARRHDDAVSRIVAVRFVYEPEIVDVAVDNEVGAGSPV